MQSQRSIVLFQMEDLPEPFRTFIWVHHGDGEKLLINVNCAYEILTHYLRKQCRLENDVVFDICDTNGRLLNINDQQMFSQILYNIEGGGDYILVSITSMLFLKHLMCLLVDDQADQP
ncbi:hypothetical protein PHET_11542, partial [Paragonimus heterotremus]